MLFPTHLISLGVSLTLLQVAKTSLTPSIRLSKRQFINQTSSQSCDTDPRWEDSQVAWVNADADARLKAFLQNITATSPAVPFDQALGSQFGAHYPAFHCGIDQYSSCPLPACSDFQNDTDDTWAYLATVSTVHLSTKFNILHGAITNGQLDFQGLIDDLADNFFAWKDPVFVGDDVALWVVAAITVMFSALTLGVDAPEAIAAIAGVGAFLGAATQEASLSLTPPGGLVRSTGISFLKKTSAQLGQLSRQSVESWANNTFAGLPDSSGNTIVDYFHGGGFLSDAAIPSASEAETFYKSLMIAKTIDWQWRTKSNFLMFASTDDRDDGHGPAETRYYSEEKTGVYYLYNYDSGKLQEPSGLKLLNDSAYSISPWQVTKSSARAWEFAGNNYTNEIAMSRIQESFDSDGTLNPFQDGPAWEGVFTIPVCDVGSNLEWLTQYGGAGLPCCCGINCADTKSFIRAANLNTSTHLLDGCKKLLKSTPLDFNSIDYGIKPESKTFRQKWDNKWSTGQKAGICIGLSLVGMTALGMLIGFFIGCISLCF